MMRGPALVLTAVAVCAAAPVRGQQPKQPWAGSARAASVQLTDTSSFGAVGIALEYRALPWLAFGAAPTLVRATSGATTVSGVGDLPVALEASGQWGSPLHPELGASVIMLLPTGQASCGVGSGVTSVGMQVATGIAPSEGTHLWADASRSFSGAITLSSLDRPQATWIDIGGDLDVAPRWTASLSAGGDVGASTTSPADREIGGGISYAITESLNLAVDATHRIAGEAPKWGLTVSLGTASSTLSPLNSPAPLGRQRQIFSGAGGTKGKAGAGGTTTTTTTCP
ncbi:MAG TPA: hypothetical protein VM736_08580 [Gemmatimonadales bacterium]|nr:hypothetical protein [Gemmatimonadales bacterium]